MGNDSRATIDTRLSRQQRRDDKRRVREARQQAKAIDKENDQERKGKKGKDKKSNEEKKRKKGKVSSPMIGFIRALRAAIPRSGAPVHPARSAQAAAGSVRALSSPVSYADAHAGGDGESVPRVLTFLAIKRIDPRLPSTWGHWWIEVDDEESYGWWPLPCPLPWHRVIMGSRGTLNGLGTKTAGTPTRDPYHGEDPDHCFQPTLVAAKSDDQVRREIRAFAHSHVGGFRWQWWWVRKPTQSCRTFQQELFDAVGLVEEPGYLYTHGPGCPFMYPFRSLKWRVQDLAAAVVGK